MPIDYHKSSFLADGESRTVLPRLEFPFHSCYAPQLLFHLVGKIEKIRSKKARGKDLLVVRLLISGPRLRRLCDY